jgi:hypothetical protein
MLSQSTRRILIHLNDSLLDPARRDFYAAGVREYAQLRTPPTPKYPVLKPIEEDQAPETAPNQPSQSKH